MIRLNLWSTRALFVCTTAGAIGARLSLRPLTWRGAKMIRKARADRAARSRSRTRSSSPGSTAVSYTHLDVYKRQGLRLPEEEEEAVPMTRMQKFKRRLAEIWAQVAGV